MAVVTARGNDPVDKLLRIFKKQVEKDGIMGDIKKKSFYEKPSLRKKKKSIAARKRVVKQKRKMGVVE